MRLAKQGEGADMGVVTVREVLTLPALAGSYVMAGESGLDRPVSGVNVMEVPDIESFVKPAELLLTTAYPMRDRPESLGGLVRTLHRLDVAALAIKPGRYPERLPDDMLQVANDLGFPIVIVADSTSFNEVIGALLAVVLIEYGAEPSGAEAIRERLTGVALAGGGLAEIARTLAGALDRGVTVRDRDETVLGEGGAVVDDGPWSFPISVAGSVRGRIVVSGASEPTLGQRRLIRQACFAAGMHIAQATASVELDRQMRVLFLEELVTGKAFDESLVRERSRLFGWSLLGGRRVVLSRVANELADAAIAVSARKSLPRDAIAWARGQEVVALVPVDANATNDQLHALADGWRAALVAANAGAATVAVGSLATAPEGIARSHADAREALAIAQSMHRTAVVHELLMLERVILSVPREKLEQLVETSIGALLRADAAAGSDLCLTLETFLGTGNAADAARTLFIHYNTMKHRMARITELLPGDLQDARFRLTVAFALQVRKLL
jgi:purine catabolism regulator